MINSTTKKRPFHSRYSNIIEPFTPQFYAQIHNKDLSVSETALCTIGILIRREMIKV